MESKEAGEESLRGQDTDAGNIQETKEPSERTATLGTMKPPLAGKQANDEAWSCPICLMWFDMPVSPPCKHNFCSGCLKSVVKAAAQRQRRSDNTRASGPACPICRETFSPEAVTPDSRIFEEMLTATVSCPNGGECSAQFCPLRWKKHQEECPSATVQCTHHAVGCLWKGARREHPAHVECCAYEKIKGLVPRVSTALKQIHTQVHHLEARIMAQNAAVANTRAVLVHQRHREAVFPVVYALLWRPPDWRRYSCPSPGDVLSNATLICVAPILFICLWGVGLFGGSSGLVVEDRAVCLVGLAILAFVMFLEYDNGSPWHEVRIPFPLQGGLAIGKSLLKNTARLVVYCAIRDLPPWKKVPAVVLLLAPLFYPPLVEAVHRFQVQVKNTQMQAQRAHAQPPLPPTEPLVPSAVKVHATVVHGVVRAVVMLGCGREAVIVGEVLAKLGVIYISAVLGPETVDALFERLWVVMSAGIAVDDINRLKTRHDTIFGEMKSPLPSMMGGRARGLIAASCTVIFAANMSYFRDNLRMIGYGRLLLSALDSAHFRLELHLGRLVMRSLRQTTTTQDPDPAGNRARDLLHSRLFLLWTVVGSMFFVLILSIS